MLLPWPAKGKGKQGRRERSKEGNWARTKHARECEPRTRVAHRIINYECRAQTRRGRGEKEGGRFAFNTWAAPNFNPPAKTIKRMIIVQLIVSAATNRLIAIIILTKMTSIKWVLSGWGGGSGECVQASVANKVKRQTSSSLWMELCEREQPQLNWLALSIWISMTRNNVWISSIAWGRMQQTCASNNRRFGTA